MTALRSPAPVMLPMLFTTCGGIVSAYCRGAPGAEVSFRLNLGSSRTCLHSSYEETSQASAPAIVRTFRTGSARSASISAGSRVPSQSKGKAGGVVTAKLIGRLLRRWFRWG
ncbi:hypothetical protein STANM309S_05910 [Streptomyces tanashiensis]